eukprot:GILJ01007118.1.p1 GENE.GILJ01007118.1~~GILJ01007118.1.p1  ORF type:complete len:1379 (-),score=209.05 GILJ01007118.1:38-4174(-)
MSWQQRAKKRSGRIAEVFYAIGIKDALRTAQYLESDDPFEVSYIPQVVDQYPFPDGLGDTLHPDVLYSFCFPKGFYLRRGSAATPSLSSFVLPKADGSNMYCVSLVFYERLSVDLLWKAFAHDSKSSKEVSMLLKNLQRSLDTQGASPAVVTTTSASLMGTPLSGTSTSKSRLHVNTDLHSAPSNSRFSVPNHLLPLVVAPKALVLVSEWPFFNVFENFLRHLYQISHSSSTVPIERLIDSFMNLPVPPQGDKEVLFSIRNDCLRIARPPANALPLKDFSLLPVFDALDVDNMIRVLQAIMLERSVLFLSSRHHLLTSTCETFKLLLFPLCWQHTYLPLIPKEILAPIMRVPTPFLAGTDPSFVTPELLKLKNGLFVVNLDANKCFTDTPCAPLPTAAQARLLGQLKATLNDVRKNEFLNPSSQGPHSRQQEFNELLQPADSVNVFDKRVDVVPSSALWRYSVYFEEKIRAAFVGFFATLLGTVHKYVYKDRLGYTLNASKLIEDQPLQCKLFWLQFLDTQAVSGYLEHLRVQPSVNPRVRFFIECMHAEQQGDLSLMELIENRVTSYKEEWVSPPVDSSGLNQHSFQYKSFPRLSSKVLPPRSGLPSSPPWKASVETDIDPSENTLPEIAQMLVKIITPSTSELLSPLSPVSPRSPYRRMTPELHNTIRKLSDLPVTDRAKQKTREMINTLRDNVQELKNDRHKWDPHFPNHASASSAYHNASGFNRLSGTPSFLPSDLSLYSESAAISKSRAISAPRTSTRDTSSANMSTSGTVVHPTVPFSTTQQQVSATSQKTVPAVGQQTFTPYSSSARATTPDATLSRYSRSHIASNMTPMVSEDHHMKTSRTPFGSVRKDRGNAEQELLSDIGRLRDKIRASSAHSASLLARGSATPQKLHSNLSTQPDAPVVPSKTNVISPKPHPSTVVPSSVSAAASSTAPLETPSFASATAPSESMHPASSPSTRASVSTTLDTSDPERAHRYLQPASSSSSVSASLASVAPNKMSTAASSSSVANNRPGFISLDMYKNMMSGSKSSTIPQVHAVSSHGVDTAARNDAAQSHRVRPEPLRDAEDAHINQQLQPNGAANGLTPTSMAATIKPRSFPMPPPAAPNSSNTVGPFDETVSVTSSTMSATSTTRPVYSETTSSSSLAATLPSLANANAFNLREDLKRFMDNDTEDLDGDNTDAKHIDGHHTSNGVQGSSSAVQPQRLESRKDEGLTSHDVDDDAAWDEILGSTSPESIAVQTLLQLPPGGNENGRTGSSSDMNWSSEEEEDDEKVKATLDATKRAIRKMSPEFKLDANMKEAFKMSEAQHKSLVQGWKMPDDEEDDNGLDAETEKYLYEIRHMSLDRIVQEAKRQRELEYALARRYTAETSDE